MRYRFYFEKIDRFLARIPNEYELNNLPKRGVWPRNWEWTYDTPDFWRNLRADIRHFLAHLCLRMLKRLGVSVDLGLPAYTEKVSYIDVDAQSVIDAIYRKLTERQRLGIYRDRGLILVGPREVQELYPLTDYNRPVRFNAPVEYWTTKTDRYGGYDVRFEIYDVPVVVLPDFDGIAIVPSDLGQSATLTADRW